MTDDKNNGDDFRHVAYGIYEEGGEIKSGVIPDHIVKADQERNAQASRDCYAKAIERANQYTEQLKAQRLERNEVILLDWLPKHKCALYLSHNDHKTVYEDIDSNYDVRDFISPEEYQKALAEDSVWHLQWYPNTPVGFTSLLASSLEALQKHVEQMSL